MRGTGRYATKTFHLPEEEQEDGGGDGDASATDDEDEVLPHLLDWCALFAFIVV